MVAEFTRRQPSPLSTIDVWAMGEEGESQLRTAFGDHCARLVRIKTRWDPGNLFRLNHNVRPAKEVSAAEAAM